MSLGKSGKLWEGLEKEDLGVEVMSLEPVDGRLTADDATVDDICVAFAEIIDAKTPFTYQHSSGVADAAVEIGRWFGMSEPELKKLRRAALLHDIGKLGVSNAILEKPGKLTDEEFMEVREHPFHTYEILRRIPAFADFCFDASAHHERLDGHGYWRGLASNEISLTARILAVADVFDALRAKRPYRDALPLDKVFSIMRNDTPHALDAACLAALMECKKEGQSIQTATPVQNAAPSVQSSPIRR